jgi:hypothetical protein
MIFPEGLCPEGNIITEGNISPNPPSGGSINDILYRKLKVSKLRIKNLTHTYVNTMFYFRINASIRRFSFELHIVWNINDNIFQNLLQNFEKNPGFTFKFDYSSILFIFCRPCCCHACCLAWSTRIMFHPMFPGEHGVEHCQKERRLANDDVRRDIAINFMLTWHKLSFLIGQFEFEV